MTINAVKDAIPSTGSQSYDLTRAAFAAGMILPLISSADVTAFNAMDNATENTPYKAVHYAGSVYAYDSGDTTSAHDPSGGVIVDGSGRRYIRDTTTRIDRIVLDKDLATPPGSPSFGDAYFVATSATGAWAGQSGDLAYYSDRGWLFEAITEGMVFYVVDEAQFYYVNGAGGLAQFPGAAGIAADSIEIKHLESPFGVVVEAEQNAPPGSPSGLIKYIVGSSPSGAWTGEGGKVAQWETSAWVFYTAKSGDIVYDKDAAVLRRFNGSAWVNAVEEQPFVDMKLLDFDATNYDNSGAGWTFAIAELKNIDLVSFSVTGVSGQRVVIEINNLLVEGNRDSGSATLSGQTPYFYIRKDSEVVNLVQINATTDAISAYTDLINSTDVPKIIDTIADGSAHTFTFGMSFKAPSATPTINDLRLTIQGSISRFVGTVETGV